MIVLEKIESNTIGSFYDSICKWYSKTYHTPLLEVLNEIDPEHIITVYYEDKFELMSNSEDEAAIQEWTQLKAMLLMDEDELAAHLAGEEIDEDDDQTWMKELLEANKKEKEVKVKEPEMSEEEKKIYEEEFNFSLGDDG